MAAATSSSETTIEPSRPRRSGHIVSSTDLPPAPSTNEARQLLKATGRPAASDALSGAAVSGSAAYTRAFGLMRAHAGGDARQQAAAADRGHDGIHVRQILHDFQPRRRVARDEPIVVERMDEVAASSDPIRAVRPCASTRRTTP